MCKIFKLVQTVLYGIMLILLAVWIVAHLIKGNITSLQSLIVPILFLSIMGWLFITSIRERYDTKR